MRVTVFFFDLCGASEISLTNYTRTPRIRHTHTHTSSVYGPQGLNGIENALHIQEDVYIRQE